MKFMKSSLEIDATIISLSSCFVDGSDFRKNWVVAILKVSVVRFHVVNHLSLDAILRNMIRLNLEFHWAGVVDHGRQVGMDVQRRALKVFI